MIDDERAVSVALTHALTMGITTVLVAGLLITSGGLLEDQRNQAVRDGLTVVGERLASEITALDRSLEHRNGTATIRTSHPDRIAGAQYSATLVTGDARCVSDACIRMESHRSDSMVLVPLRDGIDVVDGSTAGSEHISVVHDGDVVALARGNP